ncbi:MAG: hypothetical protein KDD38_07000 [Bdellovibrionales bacterium]|nr:hypothetical protein [Bdellovibrionales bacterium]
MSSVSSKSNSNTQDEAIRKAREDYRNKEAELIKKHNREITALNQKYITSLDKKDVEQAKNLSAARELSQESLTKKDAKYRKEMEDLRSMHTKQLEKLMQDNRARVKAQSEASRLEVKQTSLGKEDRVKELHDRFEEQHQAESNKFSKTLENLREDQKSTLQESREKLKAQHEKELERIRDERDAKVADLKNNFRTLRQSADQRLRNQEIRHMQDKNRMQNAHLEDTRGREKGHAMIQDSAREGYQQGIQDVRQKMLQAREADQEAVNATTQQFHAEVSDRIDGQVNRLEQDLAKTRGESILKQTEARRIAKNEIRNIQDSYQTKFDYLEKARLDTLRQSNEINSQNINHVKSEADKQLVESGRYYRQRMEMENFKNRSALESVEQDFKLRQDYTAANADTRISRIRDETQETEKTLRDNFKDNIELVREESANEKRELRLALEKDKIQSNQLMKEQIQKQEITHQKEINSIVDKYEKQIADMNDRFTRDKRLRETREKELIKSLGRQKQSEVDALQVQQADQNKQAQLSHQREMKEVTSRYKEKLDEVLRSVKKS